MIIEVLIFILLGLIIGVLAGITPGIHPNMVALVVPLLISTGLEPYKAVAFLVALGISNVFVDFIPSLLFGSPDSESGMATLPGHRMLMKGQGHHAVRLAVIGGFFSIMLCIAVLPLMMLSIPPLYALARPYTHFMLAAIVALIVLSERKPKKIFWSAVCFALAGSIGLLSNAFPLDSSLILFPMLAGFFGVPSMLLHSTSSAIPEQDFGSKKVERKSAGKSVVLGSIGGIFAGLLPGVGIGSLAALATIDRNDRSFLMSLGAIAASNALVSFLALWLIGNPRSGIAVALEQLVSIDFGLFLLIVAVALVSASAASVITLFLSRKSLRFLSRVSYSAFSRLILLLVVFLAAAFTGPLGLLMMFACAALGIFAGAVKVRRGILMAVLILPTILFFAGF